MLYNTKLTWFPSQFEKKIQQNTETFCIVILVFLKGFRKEIFYNETQFTTQNIYSLSKLPRKN